MDRRAWQASQWHHKELDMTEQLSTHIPQYKTKSLKFGKKKKRQNERMRKRKNENNIRRSAQSPRSQKQKRGSFKRNTLQKLR